jgi:DNA-binding CsgD family transcriptional regulator
MLRKLDMGSRVELAAWVVREGGLVPTSNQFTPSTARLSARQRQVATLVALGLRN